MQVYENILMIRRFFIKVFYSLFDQVSRSNNCIIDLLLKSTPHSSQLSPTSGRTSSTSRELLPLVIRQHWIIICVSPVYSYQNIQYLGEAIGNRNVTARLSPYALAIILRFCRTRYFPFLKWI